MDTREKLIGARIDMPALADVPYFPSSHRRRLSADLPLSTANAGDSCYDKAKGARVVPHTSIATDDRHRLDWAIEQVERCQVDGVECTDGLQWKRPAGAFQDRVRNRHNGTSPSRLLAERSPCTLVAIVAL